MTEETIAMTEEHENASAEEHEDFDGSITEVLNKKTLTSKSIGRKNGTALSIPPLVSIIDLEANQSTIGFLGIRPSLLVVSLLPSKVQKPRGSRAGKSTP